MRIAGATSLTVALVLVAAAPLVAEGAPVRPAAARPAGRHIEKIGPGLYRVGAVVVDARHRTARCPGAVNMDSGGPIELLACLRTGKVHESVFVLKLKPIDLQLALLLLGMKPGRNPSVRYYPDDPDRSRPPGDEATIFVEWRPKSAGGSPAAKPLRRRAEWFLKNVERKRPMAEARWTFLGSRMLEGRFGADIEGSLITTYHDPLAILELNLPTVNDDVFYYVDEKRCPPAGTPVELVIQAPPKPKAAARAETRTEER